MTHVPVPLRTSSKRPCDDALPPPSPSPASKRAKNVHTVDVEAPWGLPFDSSELQVDWSHIAHAGVVTPQPSSLSARLVTPEEGSSSEVSPCPLDATLGPDTTKFVQWLNPQAAASPLPGPSDGDHVDSEQGCQEQAELSFIDMYYAQHLEFLSQREQVQQQLPLAAPTDWELVTDLEPGLGSTAMSSKEFDALINSF